VFVLFFMGVSVGMTFAVDSVGGRDKLKGHHGCCTKDNVVCNACEKGMSPLQYCLTMPAYVSFQ